MAVRRVYYTAAETLLGRAVRLRRATSASIADQEAELAATMRLLEVARALRYYQGADRTLLARAKELAERCGRHDDLRDMLWFEWSALATGANKSEPADWPRLKGQMLAAGRLIGLLQKDPEDWARGDADDAKRIDALVQQRIDARKAKDFAAADQIRKALAEEGIEIMDGPQGSTWRRV